MISSIRGTVQHVGTDEIILEVGGVGIRISLPIPVLEVVPAVGKPFFLHTRLIVREDSLSLYGFQNKEQREIFDMLLKVGGIGPRLGLAVLSHLSPDMLRSAVVNDHQEILMQVPGIGRKTAQKVIFYLKDRLAAPLEELPVPSELDNDVLSVLMTLGYSVVEAQTAIQSIPENAPEEVEERVRIALQHFG